MARTVGIGIQKFNEIIEKNCFYVDKTSFIKEWWESEDSVTLITRPRRFGKTLTMSMVQHFFDLEYAGRGDLFEGLSIWQEEKYQDLQGTYPVISLSFANVKEKDYETIQTACKALANSSARSDRSCIQPAVCFRSRSRGGSLHSVRLCNCMGAAASRHRDRSCADHKRSL